MRMRMLIGLTWLLAASAQGLDVKITAPATSAPGDLVILSIAAEGAKSFAWTLGNSEKNILLPVDGVVVC